MTPEQAEIGRVGIELMTAWSAGYESNELLGSRLGVLLEETRLDESRGLLMACAGLAEVAGFLLIWLSQATGHSADEVLQEIAKEFLLQTGETDV